MHQFKVSLPKRVTILFPFLFFFVLTLCVSLLSGCHPTHPDDGEQTPLTSPTAKPRMYVSKYTDTPIPTLPSPYLSTPAPSAESVVPSPSPTASGLLGGRYAWRFSEQPILTDHTYSDKTISISWDVYRDEINYSRPVTFYVADVLVQDVASLTTAFAKGTYSAGGTAAMEKIVKRNRCIVAISGDFARWHENGLIVRNGEVFRQKKLSSDLCVLYPNGVMETYEPGTVSIDDVLAMEPWQSWHFGPELLDHDGRPKSKFNTAVAGRNPRSVIGYYEPGHYCLVVVDGRQRKYSGGLTMKELSRLMYSLGCVRAYNLDGGATAHMTWGNKVINSPSGSRNVHDVICICFPTDD